MSKTMVLKVMKMIGDVIENIRPKRKNNFRESYYSVQTSGFHVIENRIKSSSIVYQTVNH